MVTLDIKIMHFSCLVSMAAESTAKTRADYT